jgi:AGZA family xanthine/uracil permease-like MFS transporter
MTDLETLPRNGFDRYFSISERGSSIRQEIRGGMATFFTMAYIVVLNPLIIGTVPDVDGRILGIPQVAAVTALVAAVMTILMGVVGRYPFAVATGLGLNAFVTFSVASQMSWAERWAWWCSKDCSSPCWCSSACAP